MLFKLVLTFALLAPDRSAELKRCLALEEQGDARAAARAVERLVQEQPAWDLARIEAGRLWLAQGDALDRAQSHLDVARSLAPENPRAHYLWGLLMDERQRTDEAVHSFETALELRADYDEARFRVAGLYLSVGQYEAAAAAWAAYVERNGALPGPRLQLAAALERSGRPKDAERELKKLYGDPKTRELGGRKLAEFYDRQGKPQEAARVRKDALPRAKKLRELLPSRR